MFFTLFLQRKRFILSENALLTILMATRFRLLECGADGAPKQLRVHGTNGVCY
jgi:hypothetical protein